MKGLLLKDFCLLKKQMKLMVVFVIFYAICAVAAKIPSMMGTMVIPVSYTHLPGFKIPHFSKAIFCNVSPKIWV